MFWERAALREVEGWSRSTLETRAAVEVMARVYSVRSSWTNCGVEQCGV